MSMSNIDKTKVSHKETREGWPLLTVETEANGDLKSTYERGPSPASCACTRDFCPTFAALVGPA